MNPSAPVTSTVRSEKTAAKSAVRLACSSAVHSPFVAPLTADTITRPVRRLALTIGRLAPPSLQSRIAATRVGRALACSVDENSYEPDVRAALTAIVRPVWTCADVGEHRGLITRHLARLVGPEA